MSENLMVGSHKTSSEGYRKGYDGIRWNSDSSGAGLKPHGEAGAGKALGGGDEECGLYQDSGVQD